MATNAVPCTISQPLTERDDPYRDAYHVEVPPLDHDILSAFLICIPLTKVGREVRVGDRIHVRQPGTGSEFVGMILESSEGLAVPGLDRCIPLEDIEILGLAIARQDAFRV